MNVLHLCPGADTGGQAIRIAQAFGRHAPDWQVRSMRQRDNYIRYPEDIPWDNDTARELYAWADVVHHHNSLKLYGVLDGDQHKPAVLHHHGTRLRDNGPAVTREGKSAGATQIVSTVDLLRDCPGSTWLPSPHDLDWIAERYGGRRKGRKLRISHAPTSRRAKGTDTILAALQRIAVRHEGDFELDLIEQLEWKVCLSRKAISHLFIDQITLGYGNNAIEAWAAGVPVVSGFDDPEDEQLFLETTGESELPFYRATPTDVEVRLEEILFDDKLREEYGERGQAFAKRWHDEAVVVEMLKGIYEKAVAKKSKGAEALQRAPVVPRKPTMGVTA